MKKIDSKIIKAILALVAIIVLMSLTARYIGGSQTLTDYAKQHPDEQVPVVAEVTPIAKESDVTAVTPGTTESVTADKAADSEVTVTPDAPTDGANSEPEDTASYTVAEFDDEYAGTDMRTIVAEGFYYEPIPQAIRERMQGRSYPDDINESKVNYDCLRYLRLKYIDFNGKEAVGEMVCNVAIASDVTEIFHELYLHEYQIESIRLIDDFDADDTASMLANNTSCFCYRTVEGSKSLSNHAYGRAIDLNPFYNPYIVYGKGENGGDYISPKESEIYVDRTQDFPHKIDEDDLACKLFKQHGFKWGGNWSTQKDYQHFEKKS